MPCGSVFNRFMFMFMFNVAVAVAVAAVVVVVVVVVVVAICSWVWIIVVCSRFLVLSEFGSLMVLVLDAYVFVLDFRSWLVPFVLGIWI